MNPCAAGGCRKSILFVIPGVDAGIQFPWKATTDGGTHPCNLWIPAFPAGMTMLLSTHPQSGCEASFYVTLNATGEMNPCAAKSLI